MRLPAELLTVLQRHWGYDRLRSPQAEVIHSLLEGRDALVILPTGFGKSLCFQLPAILQTGTTLVISPLVALMEDQVGQLRQRRLSAAALHSQLPPQERRQVLRQLDAGQLRLLYLSPETLLSPPMWSRLQQGQIAIAGAIIDEAHTVAAWGTSFRPDFMRLGAVRRGLSRSFPLAAFTATADRDTQQLLRRVLHLRDPLVVRASPERTNIRLQVRYAWTPAGRLQQLAKFIQQQQGTAGLVYARTRATCGELVQKLAKRGLFAAAYHGGLGTEERRRLEREWLNGDRPFLVCTNAFGMGIDRPAVRWIAHFQPPPTIADYVQEVGRAGRDGKPATALMLASEPTGLLDGGDRQLQQYFRQQGTTLERQAERLRTRLPERGQYEAAISKHGPAAKLALAQLHRSGHLEWDDPFSFRLQSPPARQSHPTRVALSGAVEQLATTRHCRWQVVSKALGYCGDRPCGTCDNCTR
ncbi:RecQ family ATP-dependent DNA helicase [Synechococcus sp. PCC 7336]|uniref:RecQ family ATP-dependent DNA helicase n=1 Tax=Synechococcus sp. PCC 7336 TaxID=195250 RepID=UPI0004773077